MLASAATVIPIVVITLLITVSYAFSCCVSRRGGMDGISEALLSRVLGLMPHTAPHSVQQEQRVCVLSAGRGNLLFTLARQLRARGALLHRFVGCNTQASRANEWARENLAREARVTNDAGLLDAVALLTAPSLSALPVEDGCFDVVLALAVRNVVRTNLFMPPAELTARAVAVYSDARRALAPGGRICVSGFGMGAWREAEADLAAAGFVDVRTHAESFWFSIFPSYWTTGVQPGLGAPQEAPSSPGAFIAATGPAYPAAYAPASATDCCSGPWRLTAAWLLHTALLALVCVGAAAAAGSNTAALIVPARLPAAVGLAGLVESVVLSLPLMSYALLTQLDYSSGSVGAVWWRFLAAVPIALLANALITSFFWLPQFAWFTALYGKISDGALRYGICLPFQFLLIRLVQTLRARCAHRQPGRAASDSGGSSRGAAGQDGMKRELLQH
jgi:SAM-dependent methyltransferase